MPTLAIVFQCAGTRQGLWVNSDSMPPDDWAKLNKSLSKQRATDGGGGTIHVASRASWSYFVTMCDVAYRGKHAARQLTGEPLSVSEASIAGILSAIDLDEQERMKIPVELEPWHHKRNGYQDLHYNPLRA